MAKRNFYDDPVAWEFFEEIEDFKRDIREFGCADLKHDTHDDQHEQAHWDAEMFARAVAEERFGLPLTGEEVRSRGPGRRVRHRYWDKRKKETH